jgi:UDP-N-acetyl-D-glucosamine dehydrogenase
MTTDAGLSARIRAHEARIGVVGLGYVGLPLALVFAEEGFPVVGVDIDEKKTSQLAQGTSYIRHIPSERVQRQIDRDLLEATTDFAQLGDVDIAVICVPTPLDEKRNPDLRFVAATAGQLAQVLRPGHLVILESTTYPGTTDEIVRSTLERSGLQCGKDFFLAYSPEREDPGNPRFETRTVPKVVGGCDPLSRDLAARLYNEVVAEVVVVSSARVAEATKLTENIFRAVNIALVNELKTVFDAMGIDVWEVLDAAETKPFGYMRFDPGPGWGGHCIPVDPFYLSWKARRHGAEARFIELAGEINRLMPVWVTGKLERALADRSIPLEGSRVLVLGLAYKKDVADPRESPAFELITTLREKGVEVAYHDPLIPETPSMRSWSDLDELSSTPLEPATIAAQTAVVIVTDHSSVDYDLVRRYASLIIDTRGVYRHASDTVKIISA